MGDPALNFYEMEIDISQFSGINNVIQLIAIAFVYIFTELVKWYRKKAKAGEYHTEIRENLRIMKRELKRLELLNALQHFPEKEQWIKRLYGEYKALGGNSYVDEIYAKWLVELKK